MRKNKKDVTLSVKSDKTKDKKIIKNTAQKTIPFQEIYDNGLIFVEKEKHKHKTLERYSLVFSLSNANYVLLKDEDKQKKLQIYQDVFNSLSPDIHYQELYINTPLDSEVIRNFIAPVSMSRETEYEKAYYQNQLLFLKEIENGVSDKKMYFALSYVKKSKLDNPYNIIMQSYARISDYFNQFGAKTNILAPQQVLRIFYDIYNPFDEDGFILPSDMYKKGTKVADYIAPSAFYFKPKYTALGSCYNKVYFISGYASSLDDEFISSLMDNKFKIAISKHIDHIDKDIAIKTVTGRLKDLEGERQERNKKNNKEGTNYIPLDLKSEIDSCASVIKNLQDSEELFDVGIYISVSAETQEDLEDIGKIIEGVCREHLVTIKNATWRQEDGLASIVPIASDKLKMTSYLMSRGVAITLPFTYTTMLQQGGFFYGKNTVSKTPVIINRKLDKNGNGFYLGKSGSGKSMGAKLEINDIMLLTENDRVIVIDPEREFVDQCHELGGTVVKISANTKNYLNAFDLPNDKNKDEDAVKNKSDLILSLFEVFKNEKLTAIERSLIDRCVKLVYKPYIDSNYADENIPTFVEFKEILDMQEEKEIRDLSLYLEMYVTGSVDVFSKKTNVDLNTRMVVFDLNELGANIKKIGMLIVLDYVNNQIMNNFANKIYTWLYADEFHLYYSENEDSNSSGVFFERVFARCRKYGGLATGLTQNMTSVKKSDTALSMLQNSQFVVLFEQAKENLKQIADLYELSDKQKAKLISPEMGEGIIISNNIAIPFCRKYPKGNKVYKTITTDPKDRINEM